MGLYLARTGIGEAMRSQLVPVAIKAMWFVALVAAFTSARYFLRPTRLLMPNEILALSRHHFWILVHIAGGIVAITVGLFQFVGRLRDAHPRLHRAMGYLYLSSVFLAGCVGLGLSSDTPVFAADGLRDLVTMDLSFLSLDPSFLGYSRFSRFSPDQFLLVRVGFTTLAVLWLWTAILAFTRARQHRFERHRTWMMRNYSLTFAAATIRLAAVPLLLIMRDPVVAITATFWSWILNLIVVEWFIRFQPRSISEMSQAVAGVS